MLLMRNRADGGVGTRSAPEVRTEKPTGLGCQGQQRRRPSARRLLEAAEHVVDVPARLAARVRLFDTGHNRKTDALDAHSIAVVRSAPRGLRVPTSDGRLEALRMLTDRRDGLTRLRLRTVNRLQRLFAVLDDPPPVRASQLPCARLGINPRGRVSAVSVRPLILPGLFHVGSLAGRGWVRPAPSGQLLNQAPGRPIRHEESRAGVVHGVQVARALSRRPRCEAHTAPVCRGRWGRSSRVRLRPYGDDGRSGLSVLVGKAGVLAHWVNACDASSGGCSGERGQRWATGLCQVRCRP